jgi:hypothetical protein
MKMVLKEQYALLKKIRVQDIKTLKKRPRFTLDSWRFLSSGLATVLAFAHFSIFSV